MIATVFSGTSEGKEISKYLAQQGIQVRVAVATEYGKYVMEAEKNITVFVGRLNSDEMKDFINNSDFVIDATHPYAQIVTQNIKLACNNVGVKYIRLIRDSVDSGNVVQVDSIKQAVEHLKNTQGKIFVSTGSKELNLYSEIDEYRQRLVVRVLPFQQSVQICESMGLSNVIYEKGPFSYNDNYKVFKANNIKWLVTKNSGISGGFSEKLLAAKALGINVLVIKRPEETGMSMTQVKDFVCKEAKKCH